MSDAYLVQILIQLGFLIAAIMIFRKLSDFFDFPPIFGEIIGGIIMGATVLKALIPGLYNIIFPQNGTMYNELTFLIQIGMILFMFTSGVKVNTEFIKTEKKAVAFTSITSILIPFILGYIVSFAFSRLQGDLSFQNRYIFPLFMGVALSISALPIIIRILTDLNLLDTDIGRIIVSAATINDFIGWILFSIVLQVFSGTSLLGIIKSTLIIIISVFIYFTTRKLFKFKMLLKIKDKISIDLIVLLVIFLVYILQILGIHPFFSSFIIGILINKSFNIKNNYNYKFLHDISLKFFAPLFFISLGLKVDFLNKFDVKIVIIIIGISCLGKFIGGVLGAVSGGMSFDKAVCIGIGLNARGSMEIILASIALENSLIDQRIFVSLVFMALFTSLITSPLLKKVINKGYGSI